ncbi:MAG: response regulator [Spirochaetes bacterium]|nr:response regulator [Spirochaetota bacterium]
MTHKAPYSGMKILIVDDDAAIRALISKIASGWSYEADECSSAEAALVRLEKLKYNIVLTDIRMGKMDGIAFAEKLRQSMPSTAVVVMTGAPSSKTAKQTQEMGAIYYLQKPLDLDTLGDTLRIAAVWNIGMLVDRGAQRFLSLRKGHERDRENRLKTIKATMKRLIVAPDWMAALRNLVYDNDVTANKLYRELNEKFSTDSINPF